MICATLGAVVPLLARTEGADASPTAPGVALTQAPQTVHRGVLR